MTIRESRIYYFIFLITYISCSPPIDPKKSEGAKDDHPAFNQELIINIKGDSISGYGLIASDSTLKETIIMIPGYPGNDNNFDIAQELRSAGNNVILFNHRGAWGSQGVYSYANCLEDINHLITFLSSEGQSRDLRIDTKRFTLIGRSLGGGIALIAGGDLPQIKRIIAMSSVNYGDLMEGYTSVEELGDYKRYMNRQIMMNHNIDDFLQDLLDHKIQYNITSHAKRLEQKQILLIEDSDKNDDWTSRIENAHIVKLKSDHNFINEREKISNIIIEWMD